MRIEKGVLEEIIAEFADALPESGGILGLKHGVISAFYYYGGDSEKDFCISCEVFNPVIAKWAQAGISFAGIIHSHPNGIGELSKNDREYAEKILQYNPFLKYVIFPVVTVLNGKIKINCYRYDGRWRKEKLKEV